MHGASWTAREDRKLRELRKSHSAAGIARILGRTAAAVQARAKKLELRRYSARRPWTAAEDRRLRYLYPDTPMPALCREFNREPPAIYNHAHWLGLHRSPAYLASPAACRLRRGGGAGKPYRFPKGHVPANKGLRRPGYAPGRMAETQFRRGHRPQTWRPVGTVVADSDGYFKRKVSERRRPARRNWEYLHVRKWKRYRGRIPRGHTIVFRNGDKRDLRIANLECISRAELMRRNTVHNLPPELVGVIRTRAALVRQINRRMGKCEISKD